MTDQIRWGILATGGIAHAMAQSLIDSPGAELVAVGSRTQAKADTFGARWNIPHCHGSYEALAADPDVDVIYIATPHSHHADNMRLCLEAGKHVLCEKAFTQNAVQAEACIALARQKGLFLMEAMWMRFFPVIQQVRDWIAAGRIGTVRLVMADFCINVPYDPAHRLYAPALAGGALLDLGIYPISFTTMLLGLPGEIRSHAHLAPTGVDELDSLTFIYPEASAQLTCSMRLEKPREAFVVGTEGYIKLDDTFFHPERAVLQPLDGEPETITAPMASTGYIYEVEEVHACLRAGRTESAVMPLDESLALMRLMDGLRADWGVRYPDE